MKLFLKELNSQKKKNIQKNNLKNNLKNKNKEELFNNFEDSFFLFEFDNTNEMKENKIENNFESLHSPSHFHLHLPAIKDYNIESDLEENYIEEKEEKEEKEKKEKKEKNDKNENNIEESNEGNDATQTIVKEKEEDKKWIKICKYFSVCFFLSLFLLTAITTLDIYLFSLEDLNFTTQTIDFYLESNNSDANFVIRGEYPTHSTFSAYDLLNPKCIVGYSNQGISKSDLYYVTTTYISIIKTNKDSKSSPGFVGIGAVYEESIKITIDLINTEYGNVDLFLRDVLNMDTKNSYFHLKCHGNLEIQLLNYIPFTKEMSISKWLPIQIHKKEQTDSTIKSINSYNFDSLSSLSKPIFHFPINFGVPKGLEKQEYPVFTFIRNSPAKIEAEMNWNFKNIIHVAENIPSVIIHVPKISYSISTIGSNQIRWNSISTPLNVDLTHSHFRLITNFSIETQDKKFPNKKLPLLDYQDVSKFFDRLSTGEIDIVWDAETDNFLTRLLGMKHHIGASKNITIPQTVSGCYEISIVHNSNSAFYIVGCSIHDELWRFMIRDRLIDTNKVAFSSTSNFLNQKSLASGELKISSFTSQSGVLMNFHFRNGVQGSFESIWSNGKNENENEKMLNISLLLNTVNKNFHVKDCLLKSTSLSMMGYNKKLAWFNSETSWEINKISDSFQVSALFSKGEHDSYFLEGNLQAKVKLKSEGFIELNSDYSFHGNHNW